MATSSTYEVNRDVIPATRAAAVAEQIRKRILSGEFAAGSRLRQNEIAALFGVSTTPVREAFMALAREGIIKQDAHRGVIVFMASNEDVVENYEIRIALECLAAELAAKSITAGELEQLDALLAEMAVKLRTDISYHNTVLNPAFHGIVNNAARRPRLLSLIDSQRRAAVAYQSLINTPEVSDEYLDDVQAEHEEIVAALRARAPKRASKAVRGHIEHNLEQVLLGLRAKAVDVAS